MRVAETQRTELRLPGYWSTLSENCTQWAAEIAVGPFWSEINRRLDRWRAEYRARTGASLLPRPGLPPFLPKPIESIQDKLQRMHRDATKNGTPVDLIAPSGPPLPNLNDLLRTRIACQYLDGVDFLADAIESLAKERGEAVKRKREGKLEGYFAQHIEFTQSVFFRLAGADEPVSVRCEVQIASELATTMWTASHQLYEEARLEEGAKPHDWQWKYDDPRFLSHQLGHMMHLADGLLVQLRESTRKDRKS